ncbi:DNA helicase [Erwinia phage vB_EamM_EarlPhillipIV]|uniref:Putative helicase n=1 Tax=Erwinia phage vB_EamM_EarlPhillipIV TaxID=1883372 RepID=A0A1B2IC90_9CAUD|nr:DNA helicase [Erwinia phage vB_EamM_EarlPhillipIV]ANZ48888.1 putative helicase [Erwinia phage vB_EamM_EarlPhillipIV]
MFVINVMHTSMGFRIEVPVRVIELAILKFADENLHAPKMGRDHGRITVEKGDAYYVHVPSMNWFYFHKDYFHRIKQIVLNTAIEYNKQVEVKEHTYQRKEPYKCEFDNYGFQMEVTDPESRFFYQNEVVEKALDPLYLQIIFAIQTGRGKTKSAQKVMVKRGVRTVLIHRPTYVDKWKFDCIEDESGLRVDDKHVYVAKGTQGIYDLIEDGRSGKLDRMGIKVVILPTVSLFNFMKEAIATMASSPVDFESFYDDIGVGQVVYDEVHEHFLLVYLSGILLNPPYSLEMSATLKPGAAKKFIADRYLERFPLRFRVSVPYIPVVDIRGLYYSIDDPGFIRRVARMSPYNHKLFEQQLLKHKLEDSYFSMVFDILKRSYLDKYESGQKALVFFALVEMCEAFTKYVKHRLRNGDGPPGLTVAKYNAGDSYDEFIAADIGVSTPGKAGTAIDIPGLVVAIVTIAIDDRQLNEQIAGRPREVTKWDLTPKVFFLHCSEMSKHLQYLASRQESLKEVVKSFTTSFSPYVIRKTHASSSFSSSAPSAVPRFKSIKSPRKGFTGLPGRRGRRR